MKNKLFVLLIFIFAFAGLIYSDVSLNQVKAQGEIQVIQDNEFDGNYLDTYSVPTNMFNFSTDGGHSENLEKVFW